MSLFKNLSTDGLEKSTDNLGGYSLFESDAYLGVIKVAYVHTSEGGATGIALQLDLNGKEYIETVYITSKEGKNYYVPDNAPDKKMPLPGFSLINDLCMVTTEKPLSDQDTEEKMVNIYDPAERKAVPRGAQVLTELVGKEAYFGILKRLENKSVKNQSTNKYELVADTREINTLSKVFHNPTKLTLNEVMVAQEQGTMPEEAVFYEAWVKKNKGVTQDARKIKEGAAGGAKSGRPGGAPAPGGNAPKTSSLFGNK